MKYVSFIIGIVLVILIGGFVWNIVSETFIGPNVNLFSGSDTESSMDSDDEVVFEPEEEETEPETSTPAYQREGVVSISSVRRSSFSSSRPQEIRLRANLEEGETVDITGWTIQTNRESVEIPTGVGFYDVIGSNEETNIILDESDDVEIYLDENPIDENLKLNQCTGYLNEKHGLDNVFPDDCPRVESSEYRHLSGQCQDYINNINGDCVTPDAETINSFPGSEEGNACRRFLRDHFNAGYCMRENRSNDNFLSDEWRIWIDRSRVLDPDHDWVRLYNREGVLIDERDY